MRTRRFPLAALLLALVVGMPWTSVADPPDQAGPAVPPVHMVLEPPASQTRPARDSASAPPEGWQTVKTEYFDGAFPNDWDLRGDPTWDKEWDSDPAFAVDLARWTGWCAGGGTAARSPGPLPGGEYAPDMNSWMIYGPFSLRGCSDGWLNFWHWLWSEPGEDWLLWSASKDGVHFSGGGDSGANYDWQRVSLRLSDVPGLGNLAGKRRVWIALVFVSDSSNEYKGAYIDDIEITRYRVAPPLNVSVDPATGSGSTEAWHSFTTTWYDKYGWEQLKQCYFHIGASPTLANNVTMLYNAQTNKVWLRNDSGTAWLGGYSIGEFIDIENSQAIVRPASMSYVGHHVTLSVTWHIKFKPAFIGVKKLGMKAMDRWGSKAPGQWMGTWTVVE